MKYQDRFVEPGQIKVQGVAGVLFADGSVLVTTEQDNRPEYGKHKGDITVPMGTIRSGEDPSQAVVRESARWQCLDLAVPCRTDRGVVSQGGDSA